MILVTGATGNVGAELVRQLGAAGHDVRALVKDRQSAATMLGDGVELAEGDLTRPDTLDAAFRQVESAYLLLPMLPTLRQWDAELISAAKRAGVRHVVKHSNLGADQSDATTMQRWHRAGELLTEESGMAWTFIRPTGFMTNALAWAGMVKTSGTVYAPGGDGKLAVVDPRDIAAAAVAVLTQPGHEGKAYDITGPEALSAADQVSLIGEEIGRPLTYTDIPEPAARGSMLATGMPAEIVDALLEFMGGVRAGRSATVSDAVQELSGQRARTFADWVHDNASAFR